MTSMATPNICGALGGSPVERRVKAVHLQWGCEGVTQTKKTEVFLRTPAAQKLRRARRTNRRERCAQSEVFLPTTPWVRSVSEEVVHKPFRDLATPPTRPASLEGPSALKERGQTRRLAITKRSIDISDESNEVEWDAELGESETEQITDADLFDSDSDGESGDDKGCDRSALLHAGAFRRANEQVMIAQLKQLAAKTKLRYPTRKRSASIDGSFSYGAGDTEVASIGQNKLKGRDLAQGFTQLYSKTVGILQANLCLSPPARRHSIATVAELLAYHSDEEVFSPLGSPARRPLRFPGAEFEAIQEVC